MKRELRGRARTGHYSRYRVAVAFPNAEQQYFRARRILEHIIGVRKPFDLVETRPPRIWPRRRTHSEKLTQLSDLFLRMVSQIFQEGRLFWNRYHHYVSPPHSAYILLTSKDVENRKMFHGAQQFLLTNWPASPM